MRTLPIISTCAATTCSFNQNGCTAGPITVGGDTASCQSITRLDARADAGENGTVGICQRMECVHNSGLRCTAEAVTMGADTATCESYTVA